MKDKLPSTETVVLLQAGTLGGCLTLYCDRSSGVKQFQVSLTDRSAVILGDTGCDQRDSHPMGSIEEAFSFLDRYPWHQFTPHVIHPEVRSYVQDVLDKRFEQGVATPSSMTQWRRCCCIASGYHADPPAEKELSAQSSRQGPATNVVKISTRLSGDARNVGQRFEDVGGLTPLSSPHITWEDAKHFHRAVECGLVEDSYDGSYRIRVGQVGGPLSGGSPACGYTMPIVRTPEHVIGVAALARLHLDLGWPRECLGCHLAGPSLSITASTLPKSNTVHIACDIRKTVDELARLVAGMMLHCKGRSLLSGHASGEVYASQRRLHDFQQHRPVLFWAIGPAEAGALYQISYFDGCIRLVNVKNAVSRLAYPGTRCAISGWRSSRPAALSG